MRPGAFSEFVDEPLAVLGVEQLVRPAEDGHRCTRREHHIRPADRIQGVDRAAIADRVGVGVDQFRVSSD